jgi:hypothetical protein
MMIDVSREQRAAELFGDHAARSRGGETGHDRSDSHSKEGTIARPASGGRRRRGRGASEALENRFELQLSCAMKLIRTALRE